jgi:ribonuclease HII
MIELVCGVDEAGRGSAIGDVYAAAVILSDKSPIEGLRDSKKLSAKLREELFECIISSAFAWNVAVATLDEINQFNIHRASLLAMKRAVAGLSIRPGLILVDGLFVPDTGIQGRAIVKGDDIVPAISAASVLAKVSRDRAIIQISRAYPSYGFDRNKGYLTKQHKEALERFGPCPIHRIHYEPVRQALANHSDGQLGLFNECLSHKRN